MFAGAEYPEVRITALRNLGSETVYGMGFGTDFHHSTLAQTCGEIQKVEAPTVARNTPMVQITEPEGRSTFGFA